MCIYNSINIYMNYLYELNKYITNCTSLGKMSKLKDHFLYILSLYIFIIDIFVKTCIRVIFIF